MEIKKIVVENYKEFCSFEGSDYIASEFALETILRIIKIFKIKNLLELGMGIGSVSDTVFKFDKENLINYYGTENNDFCLKVLPNNVKNFAKIVLNSELKNIRNKKFDLIIIDGLDKSISTIESYCNDHAIVFVEGDRKNQTTKLLSIFPKSLYVNVITLQKKPSYAHGGGSVNSYVGGGQLIFINPTFRMRIYWIKEKISTFIKIKIRIINRK